MTETRDLGNDAINFLHTMNYSSSDDSSMTSFSKTCSSHATFIHILFIYLRYEYKVKLYKEF